MRRLIPLALCCGILLVLFHLPAQARTTELFGQHEVVSNELLVKIRPECSDETIRALHKRHGGTLLRRLEHIGWQYIHLPARVSVADGIAGYRQEADVLSVEPNYLCHSSVLPDDPGLAQLWGLSKIQAPTAWNTTTGSNQVVVAVVDSGIDYNHEDLHANMWQNPALSAANGSDDDADGYVDDLYGINAITHTGDPLDDFGHGTHVAGIIGAVGNNGIGVVGVNWTVRLMALKFLAADGSGAMADAVTCYNYLIAMKQRGVNIRAVNASWSGTGFSQSLEDAIDAAGNLGILTICAAGNDSVSIDAEPEYPAAFDSPNIISVAASAQDDSPAPFTNYGPTHVALAAPGVSILSTYNTSDSAYAVLSGTSMATPYVSGAVALLAAANPGLSAAAIKTLLLNSVDKLPLWAGKVASGGRLNLAKAVQSLPARSTARSSTAPSMPVSKLTGVSLYATPGSSQPINTPITLTAAAAGGSVEYSFQAITCTRNSRDTLWLSYYNTSPTCTWCPTTPNTYQLRVLARAIGSHSSYEVMATIPYTVTQSAPGTKAAPAPGSR